MGTSRVSRAGLADALFTPVQQRVLGLLFGQPDRRFQSKELIRLAGSGTGATHRQLERLERVGLVTVERIGNQKHYQARCDAPVFDELHGLIVKTVGLAEPLKRALRPHEESIRAAFIYGSVSKGTDTAQSDIDLLVISDSLRHADLFESLQAAEVELARKVDPKLMTAAEWRARVKRPDSFASRIAAQPRILLMGTEDDLG